MRRLLLSILALGGLVLAVPAATAQDYSRGGHRHAGHGRYHDASEHRDFHRDLYHRDAHRYPMTRWDHGRLHDDLEHDAYHDRLGHRQYHRDRAYAPYRGYRYSPSGTYYSQPLYPTTPRGVYVAPGRGFGYPGGGLSIQFGR